MKIVIVCPGSRGDVVPFTGVGVALKNSGHEVSVATFEMFRSLVEGCGLGFKLIPGDPSAMLETTSGDPKWGRAAKRMIAVAREAVRALGQPIADACTGADLLLLSSTDLHGYHVGKALSIPTMGLHLFPQEPTRDFPLVTMADKKYLGSVGNRLSASMTRVMVNKTVLLKPLNEFRKELGLPEIGARELFRTMAETEWPIRYGFSEHLVPRPADWRKGVEIAGFWWPERDKNWAPDEALTQFIKNGPPPVFVGFDLGSTSDGGNVSKTVMSVLEESGRRVVVHGDPKTHYVDDENVFVIGDVPYDWLFPQMSVLVHRCGIGTTAAGLRAGVPSVSIPLGFDRPFWARRQAAVGASPAPIRVRDLTAERFSAALTEVHKNDSYRKAAERMATAIREEDGAARVVEEINKTYA